ncbi:MAG: DNA polymerase III subunit delta [Gammaproteobacteria bacterium]|nr:DNA polymerase III subunit delta [Gammaproteobacteria bacterium]
MNIRIEQIATHLRSPLLPVYVVTGDEPLQHGETIDAIRSSARKQGFEEREVFHVEQHFDWGAVLEAANAMSLFASRKIIEVRMHNLKPGDKGTDALCSYAKNPSPDNVLIVALPRLDANAKRSRWYKALDNIGGVITVWSVESDRLSGWIARRMKQHKLEPTPEAVQFLADKVEGNMLAAAQEIEKLALLHQGSVDVDILAEEIADSAHFDAFALIDAALEGKAERVERILGILRASGAEPVAILGAISWQLRILYQLSLPGNGEQEFRRLVPIPHRQPLVRKVLKRHSIKHWQNMLCQAAALDRVNKGMRPGNSIDELLKLALAMGGTQLMRETV